MRLLLLGDEEPVKRVVVIEDNPDNRLLVDAILSEHYVIEEYENGLDALAGIEASPPDLVLLDVSLPEMDGIEVLRRLRDDERVCHIPVVALTAHAMRGDRERFLSEGFDDYVAKPIVDEDVLVSAVARLLDGRQPAASAR
ncbi:MAG: response regulator [Deltaproteobacteria bacterium]|nr:response regulator [Deltaproteobacteria bacterium]MCB9789062.1 response regulator [Deltaproteobacteria bacterium]